MSATNNYVGTTGTDQDSLQQTSVDGSPNLSPTYYLSYLNNYCPFILPLE